MKKILACAVMCVFLMSMAIDAMPQEKTVKARVYVEHRPLAPVYTEKGIVWSITTDNPFLTTRGKPDKPPGKPPKPDPHPEPNGSADGVVEKWALCIGISDYQGVSNDLTYCDDDAQDWKNFLNSQGYTVTVLTNKKARASTIEAKINDLLANEDADDYVVFTYSGHGINYQGYGSCMISTDMYLLSHGWFKSKFDGADSSHIYFAFDACEIGDFTDSVTSERVGAFASNNQYSYDGDTSMRNGVFTYYQMEGWNSYNTFEDDASYAVNGMNIWASQHSVAVDPFYTDHFAGGMTP